MRGPGCAPSGQARREGCCQANAQAAEEARNGTRRVGHGQRAHPTVRPSASLSWAGCRTPGASGPTIERSARTCPCDGENGSCKGSSRPGQPSGSCPCTRPPTTPSPSLVTSSLLEPIAYIARRRLWHGGMRPVSPPEASSCPASCGYARQVDKAPGALPTEQPTTFELIVNLR